MIKNYVFFKIFIELIKLSIMNINPNIIINIRKLLTNNFELLRKPILSIAKKDSCYGIRKIFSKPSKISFSKTVNYTSRFSSKRKYGKLLLSVSFFAPSIYNKSNVDNSSFQLSATKLIKKPKQNLIYRFLYAIYEFIRIILRALRIIVTFAPIIFLYPITYLGYESQELWWKFLLLAVEFSGPIFVKFGQWVSTRRDLFPEICCQHFSRLQRRATPHSWYYTKLILTKAFGKKWRKVFVKFDNNSEPIGSGCVAQVYKVWMWADELENKEIVEEILQKDEEETILHVSDGLEVLGFKSLFTSFHKKRDQQREKEEEEKALREWRRARDLKKQNESLVSKDTIKDVEITDIQSVTQDLAEKMIINKDPVVESQYQNMEAQNIVSLDEDAKSKNTQDCKNNGIKYDKGSGYIQILAQDLAKIILTNNDRAVKKSPHQESIPTEEYIEPILIEEWQQSGEHLEKSLPAIQNEPEDLEGLVPVALKVVHPGMYRIFKRDMLILRYCAKLISVLCPSLKWLSLEQCVLEFSIVMSAQLDMRTEAENLERFSESFSDVDYVRFPRPVRPFVNRSVLTETFEGGDPIINFITEEKSEEVRKVLAKIGVDTLIKMIFLDNFIHADLHPGNILVQNFATSGGVVDKSKIMMVDVGSDTFVMDLQPDPNPLRICLLDCGIVATLKEKDLHNFKAVFKEVVLGDGKSVADLFLLNSEHECIAPDLFREDMMKLVDLARKNSISLEQVDVGVLLQQVLNLLSKHRVRLESAFSAVVLAVFVLEGLGRSLDPQMDILERARPLLVQGMKSSLWTF